jgi:cytoskeletal protein CcmA (bactofilin family)
MFGNRKKDSTQSKKSGLIPSATSHQLNSIVSGSVIEGKISSDSDIRVDGIINGTLNCSAKVIIGPSGKINGEVHCQNAVFEGRFEGVLHVRELLHVKEAAEVTGDITTNKLIVQSGAVFNVSCTMGAKNHAQQAESLKKSSKTLVRNTQSKAGSEKGYQQKEAS